MQMDGFNAYVETLMAKLAAKDFSQEEEVKKERKKPKLRQNQIFDVKKKSY